MLLFVALLVVVGLGSNALSPQAEPMRNTSVCGIGELGGWEIFPYFLTHDDPLAKQAYHVFGYPDGPMVKHDGTDFVAFDTAGKFLHNFGPTLRGVAFEPVNGGMLIHECEPLPEYYLYWYVDWMAQCTVVAFVPD